MEQMPTLNAPSNNIEVVELTMYRADTGEPVDPNNVPVNVSLILRGKCNPRGAQGISLLGNTQGFPVGIPAGPSPDPEFDFQFTLPAGANPGTFALYVQKQHNGHFAVGTLTGTRK